MKRSCGLLLLCGLLVAGASPPPSGSPLNTPVVLPLEVIGPAGHTVSVTVEMPVGRRHARISPDRLFLQVHRPVFRDAAVNPGRGAKASVRLNGGPWVDLAQETVECFTHEQAYGCLDGSYHTYRLTLDLDQFGDPGIRPGPNQLDFRFNENDGLTNGYRVLDLDVLSVSGARLLDPAQFVEDDPQGWEPPLPGPSAAEAGRDLWYSATLVDSPEPGAPQIRATCSACHAQDGRDLKYFNYSNHAIEARSRFHGLSELEAQQIASYIRSLDVPAPPDARPWNPPYQPAPGLDARPAVEWPVGAGLDAVLEVDEEARPHLFPEGIRPETVAPDETLNLRELPVAMQFPDWNHWLPTIHPVDVWGNYFLNTTPVDYESEGWRGDVLGHYDILTYRLQTEGPDELIADENLVPLVERFTAAGVKYFLRIGQGDGLLHVPDEIPIEDAKLSIRKWAAVKLWEVHNTYNLEGRAPDVYGDDGEARSWLGVERQVFDLSPHLSADEGVSFRYQTTEAGQVESRMWYHLQAVLNAGNRHSGVGERPVDWNYYPNGAQSYGDEGAATHPWRVTAAWAKLIQLYHHDRPLVDEAYARQAHPARWWAMGAFSSVSPHTRAEIFDALLTSYMDAVESHPISEWERDLDDPNRWEPADYVPVLRFGNWNAIHGQGDYADLFYSMIPEFRLWGVNEGVLSRLIAWGAQMWPLGNWAALEGPGATLGAGDGLTGSYFRNMDLRDLDFVRADSVVAFDWGRDGPGGSVGENAFSIRWEGYVASLFSGPITFHVLSNDGVRLWVDGQLVIDRWVTGDDPVDAEGTLPLVSGEAVPIVLEYFDAAGRAEVELSWSSPWYPRMLVPQLQLYTELPQPLPQNPVGSSAEMLSLEPGAPNPFATRSTLGFTLPADGPVRLAVYDLLGRQVAVLVDEERQAGRHTAVLDAEGLASGAYVVRLEAAGARVTRTVVVVR
ncbi:MAG: PA14 domain-containing protein [Rubricoccaceae bacterium]|nr:PA14 domain-containing protein [Rubricoccaceae bacterium]